MSNNNKKSSNWTWTCALWRANLPLWLAHVTWHLFCRNPFFVCFFRSLFLMILLLLQGCAISLILLCLSDVHVPECGWWLPSAGTILLSFPLNDIFERRTICEVQATVDRSFCFGFFGFVLWRRGMGEGGGGSMHWQITNSSSSRRTAMMSWMYSNRNSIHGHVWKPSHTKLQSASGIAFVRNVSHMIV